MPSFAESDTANLRFHNLEQETLQTWVDEERTNDRETQHIAEAVGLVALSHVISVSHNDSNGSSKDSVGNSADNSISSHIAVPAINYMSTDGTVGETNSLASGHADHDCDNGHDHDEHQPDHDHSETSHAPGCSCGNCLALASNGVKDPTDHGEHDTVANVAA